MTDHGTFTRCIIACTLLVLSSTFVSKPARGELHENLPLGHWAYPVIDELLLRGYGGSLLYGNRPYTRGEAARLVIEVEEDLPRQTDARGRILWEWASLLESEFGPEMEEIRGGKREEFYGMHVEVGADVTGSKTEKGIELEPAFEPIRHGDVGDPRLRSVFPLGFALSFGEHFTVSEIAWIDTEMRNDPTARVKGNPKRPLRFRSSYLKYNRPHFEFQFGRERFKWGPGKSGSLVLGDTSPSFDAAALKLRAKWFTLTSLFSQLNDEFADPGEPMAGVTSSSIVSRYLYAHRLDMKPLPWLEFGFSETAVVSGVGRGIDLRFLNPFMAIYTTQQEGNREQRNVNLSHALHWFLIPHPRLSLYGELLVDEIILNEPPEDSPPRPNNFGFLQGVSIADPFDWFGTTLSAEYVRLNSFTYVHRGLNTDYEHFGSPIGHPLGPDTDQSSFTIKRAVSGDLSLTGGFAYRRRGEIRIDTDEESLGKSSSFLQGVVERRRIYSVSMRYNPRRDLFVKLDIAHIGISNMENTSGRSEGLWDLTLLLSYRANWFR